MLKKLEAQLDAAKAAKAAKADPPPPPLPYNPPPPPYIPPRPPPPPPPPRRRPAAAPPLDIEPQKVMDDDADAGKVFENSGPLIRQVQGDDSAGWRIPTQAPPKNAFIPDDMGDSWRQEGGRGGGDLRKWGHPTGGNTESNINFGYSGGDAGDADQYNGEDKTPNGLGHLEKAKGRWVPDYKMDAPYNAGNLPKWTGRRGRGSDPAPNHEGGYYTSPLETRVGLRQDTHEEGPWLRVSGQKLYESAIRRTASALGGISGSAVGTQWTASARAAAEAAERAAGSAAAAVPVLTQPGYSKTGLFGGITGSASGSADSSDTSLWGANFDAL